MVDLDDGEVVEVGAIQLEVDDGNRMRFSQIAAEVIEDEKSGKEQFLEGNSVGL